MREPRERNARYLGFIAGLPCILCLSLKGVVNLRVQVAHVRLSDADHGWRGAGMQEKPHDRLTVPLCMAHHTGDLRKEIVTQHHCGDEREFWINRMHIDIFVLVADLGRAFDSGVQGYPVIARHAGRARRFHHD